MARPEGFSSLNLSDTPVVGQTISFNGYGWDPVNLPSSTTVTGATVVTVDFGPLPKAEASFSATDPSATAAKCVSASVAGAAPSKDADDVGMDSFQVTGVASAGTINFYVRGLEGYLADKFNIVYTLT